MKKRFMNFLQNYLRSCVDFALLQRIENLEARVQILEGEITAIDVKADYCFRVVTHFEDELKK